MRAIITLCLLVLFPAIPSIAQKSRITDSLENILNTHKLPPSRLLGIYDTLCRVSINHDLERLLKYAKKGLTLAEKENNRPAILYFYENNAIAYLENALIDTAFAFYNKALDLAIELDDIAAEGSVYEGMAIAYWQQKEYTRTMEYFLKALAIAESIGDKKRRNGYCINISSVHSALKNYDQAIYYLEKSLESTEELTDSLQFMYVYNNFGTIYLEKKEYDRALEYTQKAINLSRTYNSRNMETTCLLNLSNIYSYGFKNYDKALEYIQESIKVGKEYGDPETFNYSLSLLADVYRMQKRWKECEETAIKVWDVDSANIDRSMSLATNIILANIHLDNKEKAEIFLWKYKDLSDQFINKDYREIIASLEAKYETEKKEIRIMALEKERNLYIGLGIAIIIALLMGLGLLFYRHRSSMQKQKIAEQEIQQLKQEKELIATRSALETEKAEREIIARDLHDGVGTMLSIVKNNMSLMKPYSMVMNTEVDYFNKALDVLDKSIVELRRVAHHIMPSILIEKGLQVALNDFCRSIPEAEFHFSVPVQRFDPEKELVLYRCAYELVNNALRHANASNIELHLNMDEKTAYLSVVDNGCGFNPQTASMGMGITNMRKRLSAFGGKLDIHSEVGEGTEANVEMDL